MARRTAPSAPASAVAVGVLAVAGALGALIMMLSHLAVPVRGIFELGPGRVIIPVAVGFGVGALLFAAVAYGAFTRQRWAWPVALVVNGLAFLSSAAPFRGWISVVVMAVTGLALVVLIMPAGRRALRRR